MRSLIGALLTLVVAIGGVGIDAASARTTRRSKSSAWTLRVETSGGFSGRGRGSVTIESNGTVTPEPGGSGPRRCTAALSSQELSALRAAIGRAASESWGGRTYGTPTPDAMAYTMTLTRGGRSTSVSWYDATRDALPPRTNALVERVDAAWEKANAACPREGT